MTMSEHTSEPWALDPEPWPVGGGKEEYHVTATWEKDGETALIVAIVNDVDDGERIANCVNACANFSTEELKEDIIDEMVEALKWVAGDGPANLLEAHIFTEDGHDLDAGFMACDKCLDRNPVAKVLAKLDGYDE